MARVFHVTDIGKTRQNNEDSFGIFDPELYIVADGMGGAVAGEIASKTLVQTVHQTLSSLPPPWSEADLCAAVLAGNREILAKVQEEPALSGMGTTATVAHKAGSRLLWAQVGDSRLYLLREGELVRITRDHSYVEELVERGEISRDEAQVHPKKNLLMRAVGTDYNLVVDTGSFELQGNDVILLASDGLMSLVPDREIYASLMSWPINPAEALRDLALNAGGIDNVTILVIAYAEQDI